MTIQIQPSNFRKLSEEFYSVQVPELFPKANLVALSKEAFHLIRVNSKPEYSNFLNNENIASVYAGHQFGSFVPKLGDGRAIMVGEVNGYEVQLKGGGKTPYSRFGDGRAVLRSTIREFLCSEAMHALGIPSTRAAAIYTTGETIVRETAEQGAVLVRLSPSHIRFGHFEFFHYRGEYNRVKQLADFTIRHYYIGSDYADFFEEVVSRTAKLLAKWQAFGFCHGVMNTDNMSILGLTIDYGPFGFLDAYDPQHICNHSDHTGRYSYEQQPGIGLWNLQALAEALSSILPYEKSVQILQTYQPILVTEYKALMRAKFGLLEEKDDDLHIVSEALTLLEANSIDYTLFFRGLCIGEVPEKLKDWQKKYKYRLSQGHFSVNPKYILRNYLAQNAIELAEKSDYSEITKLLHILQEPYAEQSQNEEYAALPPDWASKLCISCSS